MHHWYRVTRAHIGSRRLKSPVLSSLNLSLQKFSNMAVNCGPAERNKLHIQQVLKSQIDLIRTEFPEKTIKILEIASGTGEHAACFAEHIPNVHIQPTEPKEDMHESIVAWSSNAVSAGRIPVGSVAHPIALDVLKSSSDLKEILPSEFSAHNVDVIVCVNMIHISPFACTDSLFRIADTCLQPNGVVITYGPYRVGGSMVDSNVAFDESLRSRNPEWGIRDIEQVQESAATHGGLSMREYVEMPANNLCVIFARSSSDPLAPAPVL